MSKNQPTKPLILELTEAKTKIIKAINEALQVHKIPCSLLELILADNLSQIKEGARIERENAATLYKQQMKEYESEGEKCKKP